MTRVVLADAADEGARAALETVLGRLGYVGNTDDFDVGIGVGLSRFRRGEVELTVYRDAFELDLAGPEGAVEEVVAALTSGDY